MDLNKFNNVGFELSKCISNKSNSNWNIYQMIDNSKYKWIVNNSHLDYDGNIEIPTPVIEKFSDIKKYWNEFNEFTNSDLFTFNIKKKQDPSVTDAGLHAHFDYKNSNHIRAIERLFLHHPELNWIFNSDNDNVNANNFILRQLDMCNDDYERFEKNCLKYQKYLHSTRNLSKYNRYFLISNFSRNYAACPRTNTIEFRFCKMVISYNELITFYELCNRIYNYCEYEPNCYKFDNINETKEHVLMCVNSKKYALNNFKMLLKKIGMKKNNVIEKFIEDNFQKRYTDINYLI